MIYCEFCGNPTEWISAKRAAKLLGISQKTIRKHIHQGRFPGTEKVPGVGGPIYRIPASALVPLLKGE